MARKTKKEMQTMAVNFAEAISGLSYEQQIELCYLLHIQVSKIQREKMMANFKTTFDNLTKQIK